MIKFRFTLSVPGEIVVYLGGEDVDLSFFDSSPGSRVNTPLAFCLLQVTSRVLLSRRSSSLGRTLSHSTSSLGAAREGDELLIRLLVPDRVPAPTL